MSSEQRATWVCQEQHESVSVWSSVDWSSRSGEQRGSVCEERASSEGFTRGGRRAAWVSGPRLAGTVLP